MVSSYLTSEIGIHAIFGAFFFGAVFPREGAHQLFHEILERLEQVTVLLLLPVFFVVTGLNVDITGLGVDGLGYLLLVLLAACAGKFLGASLASRSQGVPARQAMALGVLMNTRGLTELVILTIGREVGVLNDAMFTIMVCMAVFTTIITEPLLRILYPDELVAREIAEAERIGSAEAEAFRVLVGTPEGDPGPTLAGLAAELTEGETSREVALVQFGMPDDTLEVGGGIEAMATSLDALHHLETAVEASGVPVFARSRIADDPGLLLGQLADESVADTILVPEDPSVQPARAAPRPRRPRPPGSASTGRRPPRARSSSSCTAAATTSTPWTSVCGWRRPAGRPCTSPARPGAGCPPASTGSGRKGCRGLPRRRRRPRDPRRPGDAGSRRDAHSRRLERS